MTRLFAAALASLLLASRPAAAQLLEVPTVGEQAAVKALAAAEAEARRNSWSVSIAVVDHAGVLLAFKRMDGASAASADLSQGKARTAVRFRRPSKAVEELVAQRPPFLALDGVVAIEGAVPVMANGRVVGAVGVSGATSQQDAQVAAAGAAAVTP
ncbi:MAG: GlcG/HbpS family heme-binding protein [Gemmatimonadaceae bacterium]